MPSADSSAERFEVDEAQDAKTRAIDTWADEMVRRSHGAKTTTGLFEEEEEDDDVPGPLALAASAARIEAEARIRAAMIQAKSSGTQHRDSSDDPDSAESDQADQQEQPEIAAAWGTPALTVRQIAESGIASQETPEDFDDDDEDDEPAPDEDRRERSLVSYVRRSRFGRGYPIPRLSKSKR